MTDELLTEINPIKAVLFGDISKQSIISDYAFVKYIYKPLKLDDKYPLTLEKLPKCHKALKKFTLCYVKGFIYKSQFYTAMKLLAENKHKELHTLYLCPNPKIAIVPNKYRSNKLVATFKGG